MQTVSHDGATLAMLLKAEDLAPGLCFFTKDEDFIQVGSWNYENGAVLAAHNHHHLPRRATRTQEAVVVVRGRVRATVYTEADQPAGVLEAGPGEVLILLAGGHGYQILEDDTLAIEIKNGPYPGAQADRRRLA